MVTKTWSSLRISCKTVSFHSEAQSQTSRNPPLDSQHSETAKSKRALSRTRENFFRASPRGIVDRIPINFPNKWSPRKFHNLATGGDFRGRSALFGEGSGKEFERMRRGATNLRSYRINIEYITPELSLSLRTNAGGARAVDPERQKEKPWMEATEDKWCK